MPILYTVIECPYENNQLVQYHKMVLNIIGLGLADEKDITVKY